MKRLLSNKRLWIVAAAVAIIGLYAIVSLIPSGNDSAGEGQTNGGTAETGEGSGKVPTGGTAVKAEFPLDADFALAAENATLRLKVDRSTGHFLVEDKRNGNIWRSYPDLNLWKEEENTPAWKKHMQSPLFIKYVEFNMRKDQVKETNVIEQNGTIADFEMTADGFKLTFSMPNIGFVVPVQVRLKDDFVEATVLKDGLKDGKSTQEMQEFEKKNNKKDNNARIAAIRLYSFLGAEPSDQENGYLMIPDGPGTLLQYKKDRPTNNNPYYERIYGDDLAFSNNNTMSIRNRALMPVFGIKSGDKALLAVVRDGVEYASLLAAPSKALNQYNWAAAEHGYRFKFFQPTDKRKINGFLTHSKEATVADRSVRYYFLDKGKADYVGMAERYRQYLMEETGMKPVKDGNTDVSFPVNILGGDTEKGFIFDSYLPLTTTDQAKDIVNQLGKMGVKNLSLLYSGWQDGGFSKYGGPLPVDGKLGGNEGMRSFAEFAHAKGHTVMLDGLPYLFNNTGRDGFRSSRDGLQDLGRVTIGSEGRKELPFVSPKFSEELILNDLEKLKSLGIDGLTFGGTLGSGLNSDYNDRHAVTRQQSKGIQEHVLQEVEAALGRVNVDAPNDYALKYVSYANGLPYEYSFDLFADDIVPFMQITLHGLVPYSLGYANLADNYETYILKNIEYGSLPSFILTYAESQDLLRSNSLKMYYSTYYQDWVEEISKRYQIFNETLGDVQDKWITGHRKLDDGVYETEYANGKRIIVNYNAAPYAKDDIRVGAKDFTVVAGGD